MIKNINPNFPVGNAAGRCKSVEDVAELARSPAEFIVVGSITTKARGGNPGNVWDGENLNSLGLSGPGIEKIEHDLGPKMIMKAHGHNKPIIMSSAGFSTQEYFELHRSAHKIGFDGVEINLGCPNVLDGGKRKPIPSFNPGMITDILNSILDIKKSDPDFFVSVKVSPMSDPLQIIDTAELLSKFPINAVVTMNTFPNGLLFRKNGKRVIDTPDKTGWAGYAGNGVLPIALGQVDQWRTALNLFKNGNSIEVWGVGGVSAGIDVRDMRLAGASKIQVGTAYVNDGAKAISRIAEEFLNLT